MLAPILVYGFALLVGIVLVAKLMSEQRWK